MREELKPFQEMNQQKTSWDARLKLVKQQFPSVVQLDWKRAFDADPVLLGRIIGDIIKADLAEPGRPGKRASVDRDIAERRLREMMGDDYTVLPFSQAFKALTEPRSIRAVAHKTGLDRNLVYRLFQAQVQPDAWVMEQVSKAFKKKPGYFLEYRVAFIAAAMLSRFEEQPESTVSLYRKLQRNS